MQRNPPWLKFGMSADFREWAKGFGGRRCWSASVAEAGPQPDLTAIEAVVAQDGAVGPRHGALVLAGQIAHLGRQAHAGLQLIADLDISLPADQQQTVLVGGAADGGARLADVGVADVGLKRARS